VIEVCAGQASLGSWLLFLPPAVRTWRFDADGAGAARPRYRHVGLHCLVDTQVPADQDTQSISPIQAGARRDDKPRGRPIGVLC
jgi:hypothetical protein